MTEQNADHPPISSVLKQGANKRNRDAARDAEKVARLVAYTLVGDYMGSDTRSAWQCELADCGMLVVKFYSHIRGRRKGGVWRPSPRHLGCIPPAKREAAMSEWHERNNLLAAYEAWRDRGELI
ncbi:hypothetical protein ABCR94_38910 [Streptomyces sp. 21So2-11]|uniref:hypothetical protein n=1 Tax=Streptomyces sp. 21So2-11 TaxID=3144408 RepID=UPI00321B29A2